MKDIEIQDQIASLRLILKDANQQLNDLYNKGMFIIISYNENDRCSAPTLEIKTAKHYIDYLKD